MKTRKLNLRFLICLLAILAVLGVGVHAAHALQIKRVARGLLQQADRAKDHKDQAKEDKERAKAEKNKDKETDFADKEKRFTSKEIDYLSRYLMFEPNDRDALPRYAELIDEQAKKNAPQGTPRKWAFLYLEKALRVRPELRELRRRQVDAAMALGSRYTKDACEHLEALLKPLDGAKAEADVRERGELRRLMGLCQARLGNFKKASEWFILAIEDTPDNVENYRDYAILLQERLDQPEKALAFLEEMVNPKSPLAERFDAWLLLAKFRLQYHMKTPEDLEEASKKAEKAWNLAPKNTEAILLAAEVRRALGKTEKARELLVKGIRDNRQEPKASLYLKLISLEVGENRLKKALEVAEDGRDDLPKDNDLLHALAELQVLTGDLEKAQESIDKLRLAKYPAPYLHYLQARIHIRKNEWSEAIPLLDKTPTEFARRPDVGVQALLLLGQCHEQLGKPDQALTAYQKAQNLDPLSAAAQFRAGSMLLAMGLFDKAVKEFEKVQGLRNPPPGMHVLVVRALIALNLRLPPKERKVDEILKELELAENEAKALEKIRKAPPGSEDLPLLRVQALVLKDPNAAQKVIEQAGRDYPDRPEFWIARAQLAGRDGKPEAALRVLDQAPKELHESIELSLARLPYQVALQSSPPVIKPEMKREEREKAVKKARKKDLKTLKKLVDEETSKLKNADRLKEEADLLRWWGGLADVYLRLGGEEGAEGLWMKIAEKQKKNLTVRLLLFDLALRKGSNENVERILEEMRKIESENGIYWRYGEASRRIQPVLKEKEEWEKKEQEKPEEKRTKWQLLDKYRPQLREARKYLDQAANQRPSWSRIPSLQAEIDILEEKKSAAIEKFKEALEKGERRPLILRQLVQLLYQAAKEGVKSFAEAHAEAQKIVSGMLADEPALLAAGLDRSVAEALVVNPDAAKQKHALELALNSVPQNATYQEYLWLGRMQWAAGKEHYDEAEKSLEKACETGEGAKSPEAWVTRIAFLVAREKKEQAKQIIAGASKELEKTKQGPPTLAACYELLGDLKQAEQYLQEAVAQPDPNNLLPQYNLASYYLRHGEGEKAKKHLRYLIAHGKDRSSEVFWARRSLALVLATAGASRSDFEEALELIDKNLHQGENALLDRRAKALVLATRGSRRKEAIDLFETIDDKKTGESEPLSAAERFTLVRLYLADGKDAEARRHMRTLETAPGGIVPDYHADYARRMLQRFDLEGGDLDEAQRQLDLLEKAQRDAALTKEIKARVLKAQGKDGEALAVARDYARTKDIDAGRAAWLLEALSLQKETDHRHQQKVASTFRSKAEEMYREYAKSEKPGSLLLLAAFLGRQHKVDEALKCCEKALENNAKPEAVAPIMTAVVREGDAKDQCPRVEDKLKEFLADNPNSAALRIYLADLYDFQGRSEKAKDLYRQALGQDSSNAMALNNLAWLLAFERDPKALGMIDRVIGDLGPSAELLDTRGVVNLELGQYGEAIKDLKQAVGQSRSANHHFHLARAWKAAADLAKARGAKDSEVKALEEFKKAWKTVLDLRLQPKQIHPLERDQFKQLNSEFKQLNSDYLKN